MSGKQIKIRDFGEKVRYLLSSAGKAKLCDDFGGDLPSIYPRFKFDRAFTDKLKVDPAVLTQWCDDLRPSGRLAPKLEKAEDTARLFGIWPKHDQNEDLKEFWARVWPSWYSSDAVDQYRKGTPKAGSQHADDLAAFRKAYCAALRLYTEDPNSSPLYFPQVDKEFLRQQAADDLRRLISKAPEILASLQRQPGMASLPVPLVEPQKESEGDKIEAAVEWLLKAPIDAVITSCQQAYSRLSDRTGGAGTALVELAQRLVPALYETYGVSKIRLALGEEIGGLVKLADVHHRTVAEIVVAAAEARATDYLPCRSGESWPIGTRSFIDHVPDSGFKADEQKAQDVRDQLARPFCEASAKAIYDAVSAYAGGGQFYQPEPGTSFSDDEIFELAGERIRRLKEYDGRSFYMMFYLPEQEADRQRLDGLVRKLAKKLPGMLFLALDRSKQVASAEIRCFDPFVWMLNKAEGGRL